MTSQQLSFRQDMMGSVIPALAAPLMLLLGLVSSAWVRATSRPHAVRRALATAMLGVVANTGAIA